MAESISVVIPTYNSTRFIDNTLRSVFAQTLQPLEVVVVDDASSDGTSEMVESIAATAPVPVRLIRSARNTGGPAGPLNRGVAVARGNLIATLDHDDLMLAEKLARQVAFLDENPDIGLSFARPLDDGQAERRRMIAHADRIVRDLIGSTPDGGATRIPSDRAYQALVLGQYTLTCSSFVFPKSIWDQVGGFDEGMQSYCDCAFVQAVASRYDLGYIDEALFRWTPGADSLSRTRNIANYVYEYINIMSRFEDRRLSAGLRREREAKLSELLLESAYELRNSGDYYHARKFYLTCFRHSYRSTGSLVGLAKLFVHQLIHGKSSEKRRGVGSSAVTRPRAVGDGRGTVPEYEERWALDPTER